MRLLHLMNYKPLGTRAIDHFILEYAKQGKARGWSVTFGFTAEPPQAFGEELCALGAEWILFDAPFTWSAARRLKKKLRNRRPDVLQTSFFSAFEKPLLWLKLRGFAKRLIVIDHSSGEGPSPKSKLAFLRKIRGWIVGRIVDAVVCVSAFNAKRDIERVFLPAAKVHVVHNGIDLARFSFHDKQELQKVRIVYVGQLTAEKGVLRMLNALNSIHRESMIIKIAGTGTAPALEQLKAYAQKNSLPVDFLGHISDVAALYGSADIAVVPSEWAEAFGLVAIEAMACGAAVVVSDAGALPEVVGDAGLTFRAGNANELSDKLEQLILHASERRRLARLGRYRVEHQFQLCDCVRKHLEIVASFAPGH